MGGVGWLCVAIIALVTLAPAAEAVRFGSVLERDPLLSRQQLQDAKRIELPEHAGKDAALGLSALQQQETHNAEDAPVHVLKLKNGMTVLAKEDAGHPIVSVQMWHRIGSHDEDPQVNGVSHLLEHLLFKGTHKRPVQFMRLFYILGADANAFTNYDVTVYHEEVERDKLEHVLTLEADRLTNALIDADHVLSERDVVISELMGYEGRPMYKLNRALMNHTLGDHGYGLPVGGLVSDVEQFTVEQVQKHYDDHYGPQKATLAVVGDFKLGELKKMLTNLFAEIESSTIAGEEEQATPEPTRSVAEAQPAPVSAVSPFFVLWYLMMGRPMFPFDPLLVLWANVLFGFMHPAVFPGTPSAPAQQTPTATPTPLTGTYEDIPVRSSGQLHEFTVEDAQALLAAALGKSSQAGTRSNKQTKSLGQTARTALTPTAPLANTLTTLLGLDDMSKEQTNAVGTIFSELVKSIGSEQTGRPHLNNFLEVEEGSTEEQLAPAGMLAEAQSIFRDILLQLVKGGSPAPSSTTETQPAAAPQQVPAPQQVQQQPAVMQQPTTGFGLNTAATSSFVLSNAPVLLVEDEGSGPSFLLEVLFVLPDLKTSSPKRAVAHVLDQALSAGHTSILSKTLDKANVNWNQVATDFTSNVDLGWYTVVVSVPTKEDADASVNALQELFGELQTQPVDEEELQRAKVNVLVGVNTDMDEVDEVAMSLAQDYLLAGDAQFSQRYPALVEQVTPADIQSFCKQHFKSGEAHIALYKTVPPAANAASDAASSTAASSTAAKESDSSKKSESKSSKHAATKEADFPWNVDQPTRAGRRAATPKLRMAVKPTQQLGADDPTSLLLQVAGTNNAHGYLSPEKDLQFLPELPKMSKRVPMSIDTGVKFTLKNGMEVLLLHERSDVIHVTGKVVVGSALDPKGKSGLSNMVGTMLMQGSANYTYSDFVMNLENDGSQLSVSPGRESLSISGLALTRKFHRLMLILREVLVEPKFDEETFSALKDYMSSSAESSSRSQDQLGRQLLQQSIFPDDHPFHAFATKDSIESISHKDMLNFYNKFYGPKTTRLVITGNFENKEMQELLEDVFGSWSSSATIKPVSLGKSSTPKASEPIKRHLPAAADVVSLLGREGISRCSDEFWPAIVANQILGGDTLSARLGTYVRDDLGLTYGVYSSYDSGLAAGMFTIRMQTAPEKTVPALKAVNEVLRDFVSKGVTDLEVDIAKRHLMSQHTLSLDTSTNVGSFLLNKELCGVENPAEETERVYKRIMAVDTDAVNAHIRANMRPEQFSQVLVGNVDDAFAAQEAEATPKL